MLNDTSVRDHHSLAAHEYHVVEGQDKAHHIPHPLHHQDQLGSHSQYLPHYLTEKIKDNFKNIGFMKSATFNK